MATQTLCDHCGVVIGPGTTVPNDIVQVEPVAKAFNGNLLVKVVLQHADDTDERGYPLPGTTWSPFDFCELCFGYVLSSASHQLNANR